MTVRHGSATRRSDAARRSPKVSQKDGPAGRIFALQRAAGNAAVSHLLAMPTEEMSPAADDGAAARAEGPETITIEAAVPRSRPAASGSSLVGGAGPSPSRSDLDAEGDDAHEDVVDGAAVTAAFTSQVAAHAGSGPGQDGGAQELRFPDLVTPDSLMAADHDALTSTITYEPSVAKQGTVSPFGSTTWGNFNVLGLVVRSTPGRFTVSFRLQNPITYNVASPKTSIASATDPALTAANYTRAASDLTPDMARQNGKPPRTRFWAQDLTLRHEKFHSDERRRLNRAGATQAQAWLNTQTAASAAEVATLVAQVPDRVITASQAAVGTLDEKESRAYGDGAPLYKARADAIRTAGGSGSYP